MNWAMELFSRRRCTTRLAQQSDMYGIVAMYVLHNSFGFVITKHFEWYSLHLLLLKSLMNEHHFEWTGLLFTCAHKLCQSSKLSSFYLNRFDWKSFCRIGLQKKLILIMIVNRFADSVIVGKEVKWMKQLAWSKNGFFLKSQPKV